MGHLHLRRRVRFVNCIVVATGNVNPFNAHLDWHQTSFEKCSFQLLLSFVCCLDLILQICTSSRTYCQCMYVCSMTWHCSAYIKERERASAFKCIAAAELSDLFIESWWCGNFNCTHCQSQAANYCCMDGAEGGRPICKLLSLALCCQWLRIPAWQPTSHWIWVNDTKPKSLWRLERFVRYFRALGARL